MEQPQHVSQMLDNLRQQLEGQLAQLNQRRQQLRQNIQQEEAVDPATRAQVAQQQDVLQNLRYEAELLNEKLMKLRANRQLIEAELFQLKDKRIKLLEDINKLEDEEMQLVSEVNRLMNFKRSLLREVPYFEERARASASLAVVQDYLAASVSHLQQQAAGSSGAALAAGSLSSPSWQGTAHVRRPSATWISMPPPAAASSSSLTTRGSGTSSMPPTPARQPPIAAEPSGTALVEAGPSLSAGPGIAGAIKAVQQISLEQQQKRQQQEQQAAFSPETGRRVNYSPFGVVTPEGLLQMQQLDASSAEGLPTVPEGQPLPASDTVEITTPLGSLEAAVGLTRSMTAPSRSGSFQSQGSAAAAGSSVAGARMPRDSISSASGTSSDSATRFSRGILASSGSIRSDWRSGGSGALGSGSFTSPTAPAVPGRSDDDPAAVSSAGEATAAARGPADAAGQQVEAAAVAAAAVVSEAPHPALRPAPEVHPAPPRAAAVAPPMPRRASSILSPTPQPPPPPRRATPLTIPGTSPFQEQQQQQHIRPPPQQAPAPQQLQQQLRLQQGRYQPPGMFLQQHEALQSPQPFLLVQQHQPGSEQQQQPTASIPQLQYQIAQIAQAQAQLAQQQQQQQVLNLDAGMTPVSVGLPGALDMTGGAAAAAESGTSISGFTTTAMGWNPPSVSMPVHVSIGQPGAPTAAGTQLWIMPTGNVAVLQPDRPSPASGDSTQLPTPAAGLSLQQVQALAAAGSSAAAAAAGVGAGVAGGGPHLPVGSGPVLLLPSPMGQPGLAPSTLYAQQTAEGMRLMQGQQLAAQQLAAQQLPGLQVTGQQIQQQLAAAQQVQQLSGQQLQQFGGGQLPSPSPEQQLDPSVYEGH